MATQDSRRMGGMEGGVLASRCCTSRWKLVLAAASCHGTSTALPRLPTQHMHGGLAGEKDAEQWTVWTASCNAIISTSR